MYHDDYYHGRNTYSPKKINHNFPDPLIKITCGHEHSMVLTNQGKIYVWGSNKYDQLGRDYRAKYGENFECAYICTTVIGSNKPEEPTWGNAMKSSWESNHDYLMKKISCGQYYSMAISHSNELYAWGDNGYGQLGLVEYAEPETLGYDWKPTKVLLENVKKVAGGWKHTLAVTHSGHLYAWGLNDCGQLGLGHWESTLKPQKVELPNVKKIACRRHYSMALTTSGEVWIWGMLNHIPLFQIPISSQKINLPQKLNLPSIRNIACGNHHAIAITDSGELYIWGDNKFKQLPSVSSSKNIEIPYRLNLPPIKKAKCGAYHTIAITVLNDIYAWGDNDCGQLGLGHTNIPTFPQKITLPT
jgi:alpha-tubulin suppressor-like RCC1 family protein